MSSDETIGRSLASYRGQMSQQSLAAAMRARGWKWSQATVWSVEKGDRPLRLAESIDVADILGIENLHDFQSTADQRLAMTAWQRTVAAEAALRGAIREYETSRAELAHSLVALVEADGTFFEGTEGGPTAAALTSASDIAATESQFGPQQEVIERLRSLYG